MIIAIDGPAGAGKSTTARGVADQLDLMYMDTGAMYRAVTLAFIRRDRPADENEARDILNDLDLSVSPGSDGVEVKLNGEDVTQEIRSEEVTERVSDVSALASVREAMVDLQRRVGRAAERGVVVEGRDIGTRVFPDADVKIYLDADAEERARRRYRELRESGSEITFDEVLASVKRRDQLDSSRELSPLRQADDAIVVDTTGLSIQEQIDRVAHVARERQSR